MTTAADIAELPPHLRGSDERQLAEARKALQSRFHPLRFTDDLYYSKAANFWVHKDPDLNLDVRGKIYTADDPTEQAALWGMFRDDFLVFANTCLWTYKLFKHTAAGKQLEIESYVPLITWPVQDALSRFLIANTGLFGGVARPVCADKSREMGVSWIALSIIYWLWTFRRGTSMLVASRKQDAVDGKRVRFVPGSHTVPGDTDTLFWKLDCLHNFVPAWLRPQSSRAHMSWLNIDNGSVINGESTNGDMARGGRRMVLLVDEAAAIDELASIERAIIDVGPAWFVSTPKAGSHYSEIVTSGRFPTFFSGWWDHPEKGGEGREVVYDPDMGKVVIDGPWRRREKTYRTRADVAENIDGDHQSAGRLIFDPNVLRTVEIACTAPLGGIRLSRRKPGREGMEELRRKRREAVLLDRRASLTEPGVWRLWVPLTKNDRGQIVADPRDTFVIGCDIGTGDGASNSVATVYSVHRKMIVADYVSAVISPKAFAVQVAMASYIFGGRRGFAMVGGESNGPGQGFHRMLAALWHPWILRDVAVGKEVEKPMDRLGWLNTRDRKYDGLLEVAAAYQTGDLIEVDAQAIVEARTYIRYPSNGCGPKHLINESPDAQATHGDRVIARVVALFGARQVPFQPPESMPPPPGSLAADLVQQGDSDAEEF